jgi:phospholipase/lecithinase/hemolysin
MTSSNPRYDLPTSHLFSLYDFLNDIIANAGQYGFKNATESCIDNQAAPFCEGYVFFDGIHPTIALNRLFAARYKTNF